MRVHRTERYRKIPYHVRGHISEPVWSWTVIFGALDMPNRRIITWYRRLGALRSFQNHRTTLYPGSRLFKRARRHTPSDATRSGMDRIGSDSSYKLLIDNRFKWSAVPGKRQRNHVHLAGH